MNKRLWTACATTAAAALALTACGGGNSGGTSADGTTTIKVVTADYGSNGENPSQAYWDGVIQAFEQANPKIKVDLQVINWNDISAKLSTMVQNKQYPDVVEGPGYASFAQNGLLYSADQVLDPSVQNDLVPALAKAGQQGGTAYGIPFVSSSRAFLINNALWQKAGLPMNGAQAVAPKTWADVETDAKALKAAGVEVPLGLPLGSEEAQAESFMWEMNNGGGYTDASGKWTIDSPANVATFQQLGKWVDAGLTEKDPGAVKRTDLYADFASGKVGMLNGMPIQLDDVKKNNLNVTWAPLPTAQAGQAPQTLGVGDWIYGFKPGGHAEQIKAFLDFAFQKGNQVKFDEEYDLLPVTKDAVQQVQTDVPALVPFLNALPTAQFVPVSNPAWDTVNSQVKTQIGGALKDPQGVLSTLQKAAQQAGQ
ncbi:extracellular solute-binding protein [Kitasatospora viridis]|uniref:Multiple sugar transport system substrate-binding protein n=1 Tax=Kitasatospora viridis TaxID=281105 RepID=A0A561SEM2_9ACTN|nr:extracellular solute-binding protein [Kitasatospora viridis]TWF73311.1 multiple sugar transport system substrate-binding protein [Kitasatospora viridis]